MNTDKQTGEPLQVLYDGAMRWVLTNAFSKAESDKCAWAPRIEDVDNRAQDDLRSLLARVLAAANAAQPAPAAEKPKCRHCKHPFHGFDTCPYSCGCKGTFRGDPCDPEPSAEVRATERERALIATFLSCIPNEYRAWYPHVAVADFEARLRGER